MRKFYFNTKVCFWVNGLECVITVRNASERGKAIATALELTKGGSVQVIIQDGTKIIIYSYFRQGLVRKSYYCGFGETQKSYTVEF